MGDSTNRRVIQVEGEVIGISDVIKKRDVEIQNIYIRTDEKHPQEFRVEAVNSMIEISSLLMVGQKVKLGITIKGKHSPPRRRGDIDKYFVDLEAHYIGTPDMEI